MKTAIAGGYIKKTITLKTKDGKILITKQEYVDSFKITQNAKFEFKEETYFDGKIFYPFEFIQLGI